MGHHSSHSSSSKHRSRDRDRDEDDHSSRKKHRSSHHSSSSRHSSSKHSSSKSSKRRHASDDEDEWVEKESEAPSAPSGPPVDTYGTFQPGKMAMRGEEPVADLSSITDGYGEGEDGSSSVGGRGGGAFGMKMMGQSSRELNKAHWQGVPNDTPASAPSPLAGSPAPGSSGSAWRMTKLKRTYEAAEEEGRDVLEVALERYGSVEAFREAEEEKRILDERRGRGYSSNNSSQGRRNETPSGSGGEGRKYIYTSMEPGSAEHSRPPSRGSFRRPGEGLQRSDSTSSLKEAGGSRPTTPVPSVFTPPPARTPRAAAPSALSQSVVIAPDPTTSLTADNVKPPLSQSELNKLQAKVLKARLMGNDDADELEKEYERERERAVTAGSMGIGGAAPEAEVRMLPTLDGRGRLYDVGTGTEKPDESAPGKRKKKEKAFETHDPKTGERIRINPDDDSLSISELVRQERFAAGAQDQKDMDFEIASRIAGDARFDTDLDYMDEHAEKLARKKMKSEVMKKAFAIQDYAKTKKALDNCTLCYGDEDQPPRAAVVALGTRAYLGLLENEELVKGHCRIVPIQHHFSMLDADDETWDEIKNFMKTLMQMFAEEDKGVFFFESCISLKNQRHTWIEAIPVSFDLFDELPAYFAEAIDTSEQEWSQHKKRIVFSSNRPFRRSLVPNLPYFAVQWDYKGEKGYGHVIEGVDDAPERDADGDELRGEMGEKGAGEFPRWFAQEIIGNVLELEPRRWRKPKRLDYRQNKDRVAQFMAKYAKYDWTKMLKQA